MSELPDAWIPVLNALLRARVAWQTPAQLAESLGRDGASATDVLCDLDIAGWIVVWESEDGPFVTLSPVGATRLGVHLIEVGFDQTPRWAPTSDPGPAPAKPMNVCRGDRAAALEFVPDPYDSPDVAAERAERAGRAAEPRSAPRSPSSVLDRRDELPRPSILIGLGLTPWPGPGKRAAEVCPACGSRRLQPHMYCLYCDRWGLDEAASALPGASAPSTQRTPRPSADRQADERLRAQRKAKRRRRRQEQSGAWRQAARRAPKRIGPVHPSDPGSSDDNSASASR